MRKLFAIIAALVISVGAASAQQSFAVGEKALTAGVGVGGWGIPLTVGYEQSVYEFAPDMNLGVGGNLGLSLHNDGTFVYAGAMANYHYTGVQNWDFFGGLALGYYTANDNDASIDLNLGAKYYFNDAIALYGKFGMDISYFTLGLSFKL